jgi:hypothetical protein
MLLQLDDDGFGQSKLLIIRDRRVFWMGHKGDMEHKYTLNKGRLPEDLIEKMREAFASASERYLVTTTKRHAATQDVVRSEMIGSCLKWLTIAHKRSKLWGNLSILDSVQVSKILEDRQKTKLGLNANNQKAVLLAEVEQYINQGWEYVPETYHQTTDSD